MNAAACPPALPTLRRVTAGFAVAVVAVEYRVATDVAPLSGVAIGGAMELHRLADDAGAGRRRRVDLQVAFGSVAAGVGQAEQACELLVGPHRDRGCRRP